MNIYFDQPLLLLLGLIALPLMFIGMRSLTGADLFRRWTLVLLRTILLCALTVTLAGPHIKREHNDLTVIGLLDISGSVQRFARLADLSAQGAPGVPGVPGSQSRSYIQHLREWFREATQTKASDDRFGLVVFDGEAIAAAAPTRTDYADDSLDVQIMPGTSIAEAIRLGLAMFPADTAKRLVLVSDGNETIGDAIDAARQAAGGVEPRTGDGQGIPIDVLPIAYRVTSDAQILSVETPPNAQPGQTVTVRIIMEASSPIAGRLTLRREGNPVDLNGSAPGNSRPVTLPVGRSVHLTDVELGDTPVNRFEAIFEPDIPMEDVLPDNNRAVAFTATPGKGRVLVLDNRGVNDANVLGQILRHADIPVEVRGPQLLPDDLLSLQNFDLIVLDDVPAFELSQQQHELISRYVNDLGGGLVMIGGENSFGAGGWNGTAVEDVLPLELDPPKEMRLPQAALVLVLDRSGSMNQPVAGARGATQQEVANEAAALAIESLRAESLIGVVTFNTMAYERVPIQSNDDPQAIAARVRSITAGGGTDLYPALVKAHAMLSAVEADRKHVVCLTDGQSDTEGLESIARRMANENMKINTIAVGDSADHNTLQALAAIGGGQYYPVYNPRALPRVLVDSVQILNKPLIKEVPFVPVVLPTGSSISAGMDRAPQLGGLVVTAPRDDPKAVIEMIHPDGEPLLARWQAGVGRVCAFTSDLGGPWSEEWTNWPEAIAFWTQLIRSTARPNVSHDAELLTELKDGRLHMTLEAADQEEGFLDYLQVEGTVYTPDRDPIAVRLRQTAPGRYEASIPARMAGNYIVALNPRRGDRRLSPVIGGASRSTGEEFRRYNSNLAMLEEIVDLTGGRRLDIADPASVNLFDRSAMPASVSLLPAWRTLIGFAIVILLLDVAGRRIAWSAVGIRGLAADFVTRVTPSAVRGRQAAATLATLRTVSDRLDDQLQASSRHTKKLQPPAPVAPPDRSPPPESDIGKRRAPEPGKVTSALNTLLGRSIMKQQPNAPLEQEAPEEPKKQPDSDNIGSTETTSGLLAAKRRARKRLDEEE